MAVSRSNVKSGLLLILIGVVITIVTSIIDFIATLTNIPDVNGYITLIGSIFQMIGILLCGLSYSKGFRYAFYCVVGMAICSLLTALFKTIRFDSKAFIPALIAMCSTVKGILDTLFIIFVITGCGDSTFSGKVRYLAYVTLIITVVCYLLGVFYSTFRGGLISGYGWDAVKVWVIILDVIKMLLHIAYNVLFFVLLIKTYKTC